MRYNEAQRDFEEKAGITMKEFFGFGGYERPAEGFLSWQHLTFVTAVLAVMVTVAVLLGRQHRHRTPQEKNRVLVVAAIAIDAIELFKIVMICVRAADPWGWLYELPLFLCSIQLITLPLAAFGKGRVKQAALDFVFIFGILGALLGTYGAGNNYSCYPVLGFDNVVSAVTHAIAGFSSLYIALAGLASMQRRNIRVTCAILGGFCAAAYIVNHILDYNYMFLVRGDGTPYDLLYNLVGGHPVWYPLGVVALFVIYIMAFYGVCYAIRNRRATLHM